MASETTLPLTGGCNCGAVRFEVSEAPPRAIYCHCTRCQRRTGTAAAASAFVTPGSARVVAGEEHVASWNAGDGFDKVFCRTCGSALFARDPDSGEIAGVRLGAFDSDPGVRPSAHQYVAYAAVWEPLPDDGLERFEEARATPPR
jgi:hypothetical protein